jgi:hemoglobin-like flavoprotein
MPVLATTTRVNNLADDPDAAIMVTLSPREARLVPRPAQYPVIGAVALDEMAAIAGPPSTPDYNGAWNTAFETVAEAMFAGAADAEMAAAHAWPAGV